MQSSLADIDRKLRELQRELTMVFDHEGDAPATAGPEPVAAPPPVPAPSPPPAAVPPLSLARPLPAPAPAEPGTAEGNTGILADAHSEAAQILDEAAARLTELGRQVDELQRLLDSLQRSTLVLQDEYSRASRSVPVAGPAPSVPEPSPAAPPAPAPDLGVDRRRPFQGAVVVNAGPFGQIGTLGAFEQSLASVPGVQDVYVRSFEGNRALIDARLETPVHLVDELRRTLPMSFDVVEIGHQLLTINVDAPPRGAQ